MKQRRGHAEAHVKIFAEIVEDNLSTKQDIKDIRADLEKLEYRLIVKIGAMTATIVTLAIGITAALNKLF